MRLALITIFVFYSVCLIAQPTQLGRTFATYTGDSITMSKPKVRVANINGRAYTKKLQAEREIPILLNGDSIHYFTHENYYKGDKINEQLMEDFHRLGAKIDAMINEYVDSLPSGVYSISIKHLVVNTEGRIVYFDTKGIEGHATNNMMHLDPGYYDIPPDLRLLINTNISKALKTAKLPPLIINNKRIPYYRSWATSTSKGDKTIKASEPKAPKSLYINTKEK